MSDNAPPPYPYGQQAYLPQDHPQATLILILGILGLVACQVLSPFAWIMGNKVVREIDASQGQIGGRSTANAGRICGMIGSILLALGILVLLFVMVLFLVMAGSVSSSETSFS